MRFIVDSYDLIAILYQMHFGQKYHGHLATCERLIKR